MNIKEIKKRLSEVKILEADRKALWDTIGKWESIVDGTGVDLGAENCQLCQLQTERTQKARRQRSDCKNGCIIAMLVDHCGVLGYEDWEKNIKNLKEKPLKPENFENRETYEKALASAKVMLRRLRTIYDLI